ncbi:HNH endonuclease [Bremerella volcania]|uniref:HNH endonuclease n=1 Tax=Bremerella volcania TaxID=2527984 RepID=A0A518C4C4_9BACT|nr:HNH endonuclease [Bremerella volcania]QDU74061.1 HNH endonuclease [Bremerella volcania]
MAGASEDAIRIIYFVNTDGRPHQEIYGNKAFFDLKTEGPYASKAVGLPVGQECVVASYANKARTLVNLDWYSFSVERIRDDDQGRPHRVFFGNLIFTETLDKADAAKSNAYDQMFNVNGDFKRPSALENKVAISQLPTEIGGRIDLFPDEVVAGDGSYIEGALRRVEVNAYERNPQARRDCIAHYKPKCVICKFDFGKTYGPVAEGFMHVHHLKPLHELKESYRVDPVKDLRPVCPNCHAVIHLGGSNRSISEVKKMLQKA